MPPISGAIPAVVRSASNFAARVVLRLPPKTETSYDSDEFPKFAADSGESDCPQHCGAGEDCLEAIELPSGRKVGALLSTDLTDDGVRYTQEAIAVGGEVAELWAEEFSHYL